MDAPVFIGTENVLSDRQKVVVTVDELEGKHGRGSCRSSVFSRLRTVLIVSWQSPVPPQYAAAQARSLPWPDRQRHWPAKALLPGCTSQSRESESAFLPY